jgi:hypothetical protein
VIPITFRLPDRGLELDVQLADETFRPLIGELRLARPQLASRVEQTVLAGSTSFVEVHDRDAAALAVAARVLLESRLVDDSALEHLAQL